MDASIIIYIVALLLGIFGVIAFTKGKKQKVLNMNKNLVGGIGVGLAIFLLLLQMGYLVSFNPSLAPLTVGGTTVITPPAHQQQTQADVVGCDLGTKTTVTLSAVDKYTSSASGGTHRYRINGAPAQTVSNAGTLTASPGDKIQVLWYNASTSGYFGKVESYTVPCTGAKTFHASLVQNGTISFSLKDSDDNTIDGTTNNQTLASGDVKNVKVKMTGQYQREIPHGFIVVVEYNKTAMDNVVLTLGGSEIQTANIPHSHSATLSTDSVRKAYKFPALVSNGEISFTAMLDASDSTNPAIGDNVLLTFYPMNYFINSKNQGAFEGPSAEDEDNAVTRSATYSTTIYVD